MPRPSKKLQKDASGEPIEMASILGATGRQGALKDTCADCTSNDPQVRARHYLALAKQGGLDEVRPHLYQHYGQMLPHDERREAIESVCTWVGSVMQQWSGFADLRTGAKLPWWEARQQTMARRDVIAEGAYGQAPQAYCTAQERAHEQLSSSEVTRLMTQELERHVQDAWGYGHMLLMAAGLGRPHNYQQTAEACRRLAKRWPEDSDAWEREALWWELGAQGKCNLDREPGEDDC